MKKKFIGTVLAALLSVFCFYACGGSSMDADIEKNSETACFSPVDDFFESIETSDNMLQFHSIYNKKMFEKEHEYDGMLANQESLKDYYIRILENLYGENVNITYNVSKQEKLAGSDLDHYKELYKIAYNIDTISEGYDLKLDVKFEGSDGEYTKETDFIVLNFKDMGWLLFPNSVDDFLRWLMDENRKSPTGVLP